MSLTPNYLRLSASMRSPLVSAFRHALFTAVFLLGFSVGITQFAWGAAASNSAAAESADSITLREGDEIRIEFPGAPDLNTQQRIRSDGKITLSLVGEITATGMTPAQLREELLRLYGPQLVFKEVSVILLSRSFFVYVNGAVGRRGRIDFDHPVDVLEALMAAGFDDQSADLKDIQIYRIENGRYVKIPVDMRQIISNRQTEPIYLKQADMILVPTRLF